MTDFTINIQDSINAYISQQMQEYENVENEIKTAETNAIFADFAVSRAEIRALELEASINKWNNIMSESIKISVTTSNISSEINTASIFKSQAQQMIEKVLEQQKLAESLKIQILSKSTSNNNSQTQSATNTDNEITTIITNDSSSDKKTSNNSTNAMYIAMEEIKNLLKESIEKSEKYEGIAYENFVDLRKLQNTINFAEIDLNHVKVADFDEKIKLDKKSNEIIQTIQSTPSVFEFIINKLNQFIQGNSNESTKIVLDKSLCMLKDKLDPMFSDRIVIDKRNEDRRSCKDRRLQEVQDSKFNFEKYSENREDVAGRRKSDRRASSNHLFISAETIKKVC